MTAIMISVKPKYCALEMNGVKNIEVRKNKALANAIRKLIDENGYADMYVYCSKDNKKHLYPVALLDKHNKVFKRRYKEDDIDNRTNYLNGKVVFKFRCYKVEEIPFLKEFVIPFGYENYDGEWIDNSEIYNNVHDITNGILEKTCLSYEELQKYLGENNGYAIHISDLEIFDRPKELREFRRWVSNKECEKCSFKKYYGRNPCLEIETITKAPQNFCYVEEE